MLVVRSSPSRRSILVEMPLSLGVATLTEARTPNPLEKSILLLASSHNMKGLITTPNKALYVATLIFQS